MQSHEVMKEVLKQTSAKQIAADMNLSLSLVYKWAEPVEPGVASGSPLERVGQLVRVTKDVRVAQWVCEQADGFYIRNPHSLPLNPRLIPATNDIVQEFADMLATIAQASADNEISAQEAKTIRRRWEELKTVTETFVRAAETGNFGPVEAAKEATGGAERGSAPGDAPRPRERTKA